MIIQFKDVRSNHDLINAKAQSGTPGYIFFWSHKNNRGGVNKACFSQWYDSPFTVDDTEYLTAEHYMMAGKARLFNDETALQNILSARDPGAAKHYGREVTGFVQGVWEKHRFEIVVRGNMVKFSQHDELRGFLLATGNRVLVEASPIDRIWGIGLTEDDADSHFPEKWQGLNLLGYALMEVRSRLAAAGAVW